jgi:hypothetical protein
MLNYFEFAAAVRLYGLPFAVRLARTLGVPCETALIYTQFLTKKGI